MAVLVWSCCCPCQPAAAAAGVHSKIALDFEDIARWNSSRRAFDALDEREGQLRGMGCEKASFLRRLFTPLRRRFHRHFSALPIWHDHDPPSMQRWRLRHEWATERHDHPGRGRGGNHQLETIHLISHRPHSAFHPTRNNSEFGLKDAFLPTASYEHSPFGRQSTDTADGSVACFVGEFVASIATRKVPNALPRQTC